jgi:asparagine synthase (glutamine-hydrolysing)
MCGIFFVRGDPTLISKALNGRSSILDRMKQRGPDEQVFKKIDKTSVLAYSRLSIIDIDHSTQPAYSDDGRYVLIFNGEIYNYKDLRSIVGPVKNRGTGEAEVLLQMFLKFKENFAGYLSGMYAIIIYDLWEGIVFSIRDRFGIKPLYFSTNGGLFLSSRIDLLTPLIQAGLNKLELLKYFQTGLCFDSDKTFFDGVSMQPPATVFRFENNKLCSKSTYWSHLDLISNKYEITSKPKLIDDLYSSLRDSINTHLLSERGYALNLSAGLDSNFIRLELEKQMLLFDCYSYCYQHTSKNECLLMATFDIPQNHYKTPLHANDIPDLLSKAIKETEGPVGGVGMLGYFKNMIEARDNGVRVMLTGQGADELFAGYQQYLNPNRDLTSSFASDGTDLSDCGYLTDDFVNLSPPSESEASNISLFGDYFNDRRFADLTRNKLPKLLVWQDKLGMANSVEARVPFLDHKLFERFFLLDKDLLIKGRLTKHIFREVAQKKLDIRSIKKVSDQGKIFMPTPQPEWIKLELKAFVSDLIDTSVLADEKIVDKSKLRRDFQEFCASTNRGHSFFIWKFLNAELIFRMFAK